MLPKLQPDVCPIGISVLAVSPYPEDHRRLTEIFQHSRWQIRIATNLGQAVAILRESQVSVVICEHTMPDGDWRALCRQTAELGIPCRFLVARRHADEQVWAEILDAGGYDCLSKPFRADEVYRLVSLAWRSWNDERNRSQQSRSASATQT